MKILMQRQQVDVRALLDLLQTFYREHRQLPSYTYSPIDTNLPVTSLSSCCNNVIEFTMTGQTISALNNSRPPSAHLTRMIVRTALIAAAIYWSSNVVAKADPTEIAKAGGWTSTIDQTFYGVIGREVSLASQHRKPREFAFYVSSIDRKFGILIEKEDLKVQRGTMLPIIVYFSNKESFHFSARAAAGQVVIAMSNADIARWDEAFTTATMMTVTFSSLANDQMSFDLAGTRPTIQAVATALTARGVVGLPRPWSIDGEQAAQPHFPTLIPTIATSAPAGSDRDLEAERLRLRTAQAEAEKAKAEAETARFTAEKARVDAEKDRALAQADARSIPEVARSAQATPTQALPAGDTKPVQEHNPVSSATVSEHQPISSHHIGDRDLAKRAVNDFCLSQLFAIVGNADLSVSRMQLAVQEIKEAAPDCLVCQNEVKDRGLLAGQDAGNDLMSLRVVPQDGENPVSFTLNLCRSRTKTIELDMIKD